MGLIVMVYNYVCAHGPAAGAGKSTTIFHIIAGADGLDYDGL